MTMLEKLSELRGEAPASSQTVNLDHVTLRTHDLDATRDFLEALLAVKAGFRPNFGFPGHWLYAGHEALIHLIPVAHGHAGRSGEAIDHVGFRLTDHREALRRLDKIGAKYSRMELPELGERRLFVRTPGGVLLELVFRDRACGSSFCDLNSHSEKKDI